MINFKKIGNFLLLLGFVVFITFFLSNFIGLSRAGFESAEVINLQTFYIIAVAYALIVLFFYFYSVFVTKFDIVYGYSVGFNNQGEFPHLKLFKRFTTIQLTFFFFIIFLIFNIININFFGSQSYTGVGLLETQQFTETDSLVYSTLLIPGAENLGAAALIATILVIFGLFARKYKLSRFNFRVFLIILIILLVGLYGLGNHLIRYGGSEISQTKVFFFWAIGGLITFVTGSFIPFWILHTLNNFFIDIGRFFSNDSITIMFMIITIGLMTLYGFMYKGRLFGGKNVT